MPSSNTERLTKNSDAFTEASLYGAQQSLKSNLGLTLLPIITSENTLSVFKDDFETKGSESYPFAYLKVSSFGIDKTHLNNKTIARRGTSIRKLDTNALITKNYQFASNIEITLLYMETDFRRVLQFVERFSIINSMQGFNFKVGLPKATSWTAELYSTDDTISIPTRGIDDGMPSTFALEIGMTLKTKAGLTKDVALSTGTKLSATIIKDSIYNGGL